MPENGEGKSICQLGQIRWAWAQNTGMPHGLPMLSHPELRNRHTCWHMQVRALQPNIFTIGPP